MSGADDVEQSAQARCTLNSSDLELVTDGSNSQMVGLRFTGIDIPQGAIITNAYIQFTTDEVGLGRDLASHPRRGRRRRRRLPQHRQQPVLARDHGRLRRLEHRRPGARSARPASPSAPSDLSAIVQEIVARSGWLAGNDMAFVITGTGRRTAEAFEERRRHRAAAAHRICPAVRADRSTLTARPPAPATRRPSARTSAA